MEKIIEKAKKHCLNLLKKSRCRFLPFHNVEHTMQVYEYVLKIGAYEERDIQELEPVLLAALFHDTGNATEFKGHENFSTIEANHFLAANNYPIASTILVFGCINATRMPQEPKNSLEKIICDADLFHLGTNSFRKKNKLLRIEWYKYWSISYTDKEWTSLNILFLDQHKFHTKYGQEILEPLKQENLRELKLIASK